ncbi:putative multidrug resistance-associated protein lethal [Pseudolycoriella hygida]|uniref:Multidrug resistance-associated protein lethal n=1 Tax=Pseudolycoriella hygida TaxID=35572 RepID=A0A9Q0MPS1_9DIPT|nr:putative multidrug resistance-associated protein lethal [Pseudolycoriella hygida]
MMYQEQSEKSLPSVPSDTDNILSEKMQMTDIDDKTQNNEKRYSAHLSEAGINVKNVTARWDKENYEETLDNVNLLVQPGTLVAIIGPVGSGKSSLIQAILGELKVDKGTIDVNGVVSYASQEPWLFSGTVRSNILFGQPMDKERYNKVVRKCALERDFALFPYGDKTIVGERGQSLSGGQKARISLARACYRQAGIYLLDDPLSAVDTHVGKHLFDQCLRDLLRNKIVILVTHQLQYLQHVDQIVILNHGRVEGVGTYDSLRETGLDFAKLLAAESKDDQEHDGSLQKSRSNTKLNRQSSESSTTSLDEKGNESAMQVEERSAEGAIGMSLYTKYFKAGGGFCFFYIMIVFCLMSQLLASGGDYFVSFWVTKEEGRLDVDARTGDVPVTLISQNESLFSSTTETMTPSQELGFLDTFMSSIGFRNLEDESRMIDIYIFTGITIATVVITLSRSFLFFTLAMKASTHLHNLMFEGVTRATMFFFNTNPSGRILNRFSKDMGQVDEILPSVMIDVIQIFLSLGGIIVVVAIVNYWFLIPTLIIGVIFYYLRNFYLMTSRNVKRMEATTRSPIYSHLGASLNGLSTIRAFKAQDILVKEFDSMQDLHSSAFYLFISTSRAFGFWLDAWCVVYIAIVTLSFFIMGDAGGNVGLAITQAMGMTGMVQWGMRQSAELENTMTAVERVVEYETVDPEDELESTDTSKKPPPEWPEEGDIKFDRVSLRYFPDPQADLVLKDLEFHIMPKEKVGIVGRTGAGKSSLINALFRLSYNEGSILIDRRDTNSMGLHELRTKISIIPQEPVLFSGTMRYNLDPFDDYSDDKLWSALEEVKLKAAVMELPQGLQSRISEGGGNFSIGQRQLVCLARAILRENRILVMDEATANVDPQTDALIQATIRDKFANCTILTIAHRLHTVMDSDKVLVMDAGRAVEFGSPYELLTTKTGPRIFYGMVQETGRATYEKLFQITKQVHEQRLEKSS